MVYNCTYKMSFERPSRAQFYAQEEYYLDEFDERVSLVRYKPSFAVGQTETADGRIRVLVFHDDFEQCGRPRGRATVTLYNTFQHAYDQQFHYGGCVTTATISKNGQYMAVVESSRSVWLYKLAGSKHTEVVRVMKEDVDVTSVWVTNDGYVLLCLGDCSSQASVPEWTNNGVKVYYWEESPQNVSRHPFIPAATFQGARQGYVFTRSSRGIGYYLKPATGIPKLSHKYTLPLPYQVVEASTATDETTMDVYSYHTKERDLSIESYCLVTGTKHGGAVGTIHINNALFRESRMFRTRVYPSKLGSDDYQPNDGTNIPLFNGQMDVSAMPGMEEVTEQVRRSTKDRMLFAVILTEPPPFYGCHNGANIYRFPIYLISVDTSSCIGTAVDCVQYCISNTTQDPNVCLSPRPRFMDGLKRINPLKPQTVPRGNYGGISKHFADFHYASAAQHTTFIEALRVGMPYCVQSGSSDPRCVAESGRVTVVEHGHRFVRIQTCDKPDTPVCNWNPSIVYDKEHYAWGNHSETCLNGKVNKLYLNYILTTEDRPEDRFCIPKAFTPDGLQQLKKRMAYVFYLSDLFYDSNNGQLPLETMLRNPFHRAVCTVSQRPKDTTSAEDTARYEASIAELQDKLATQEQVFRQELEAQEQRFRQAMARLSRQVQAKKQ